MGKVTSFASDKHARWSCCYPQPRETLKFWSHDITWSRNLPFKSQTEQIGQNDSTLQASIMNLTTEN